MPKFFFDLDDGQQHLHDIEGSDLPDRQAARSEAISALSEIARAAKSTADRHEMAIVVRDASGLPIMRAELSMHSEWLA